MYICEMVANYNNYCSYYEFICLVNCMNFDDNCVLSELL